MQIDLYNGREWLLLFFAREPALAIAPRFCFCSCSERVSFGMNGALLCCIKSTRLFLKSKPRVTQLDKEYSSFYYLITWCAHYVEVHSINLKMCTLFTDRVMQSTPSVCWSVSTLSFEPIDLWCRFFACVWVTTTAYRELKIMAIGEGETFHYFSTGSMAGVRVKGQVHFKVKVVCQGQRLRLG